MRKKKNVVTNGIQEMTREELTRTQVLNLSDFEKVAEFEKSTSKRPAIFLAILGIFCIMSGFSYNPILNIVIDSITPEAPQVSKRIKDMDMTRMLSSTISCHYTNLNTPNGLDINSDMTLTFYDNKLNSYTKTTTYVASLGKEKKSKSTTDTYYNAFKALETINIPGYKQATSQITNGLEIKTIIDLKNLNASSLTTEHNGSIATKVEFTYESTIDEVLQQAKALNYDCK